MNKHFFKDLIHQSKQIILFACGFSLFACNNNNQAGMNMVKEYAVATLGTSSSDLKRSFPATIKGKQDIEIRPKISGFITELCVDEGSIVHKGQTLFIIDPVPYEAAAKVAEANVKVAQTNVATMQLTYDNKKELRAQNIISDYELQMAENNLATAKAQLAQAEAQLINAKNDLSYTRVTSPSNGVAGTIPFRVGSLVSSSTQTPLTVVSNIDEMFVYFSMTEKELLSLVRQGGTVKEILEKMPKVELKLADGTVYSEKGTIETLSGVIDQTTGAASIRATFPNDRNILRSGGSGVVLIPYSMDSIVVIPQKATYEIQDKKFVYVVQNDSTVKNQEIEIFNLDDGKSYIVTSGLTPGQRIVVEGVGTLKDGMKIKPITPEEAAAKIQQMTQQQAAASKK
ncbi:MAG: efflux RND transporter periplasmic adaptor subunit [Bacteroidales bacterium]|nr:efflux RND transporter periplasmic adaptor subunit [Bacteroidales bacterium]